MDAQEYGPDYLTLVDEEGKEHEFEVLDSIDRDDSTYLALLPSFEDAGDKVQADGTYYIFEVLKENGEEELAEVDDDDLLDELAAEFESHFSELYDEEDAQEAFPEENA